MKALPLKHRPQGLDQVIGQAPIVAALREAFAAGRIPQAILLTGPSGVGKTTLARIIAARLAADVLQVDATAYNGVAEMRELVTRIRYRPLARERKAVILEEAHGLSAQAWQTLLLPLEEPPAWVHWLLCTTEPAKVPPTVATRCHRYSLRPVARAVLLGHLRHIAQVEGLRIADAVLELCAQQAKGSVRQALTNVETCHSCHGDVRAARRLLLAPVEAAAPTRKNGTGDLLEMVRRGLTRDQMADALHVDRTTIWRRLAVLVDSGTITKADIRRG